MSNAKENECIERRITFTSHCPSVVRALQIKFKSLSKDYLAIAEPPTTHMCIKPMSPDSNTYSERHGSIVFKVVFHIITKFVSRFWKLKESVKKFCTFCLEQRRCLMRMFWVFGRWVWQQVILDKPAVVDLCPTQWVMRELSHQMPGWECPQQHAAAASHHPLHGF